MFIYLIRYHALLSLLYHRASTSVVSNFSLVSHVYTSTENYRDPNFSVPPLLYTVLKESVLKLIA